MAGELINIGNAEALSVDEDIVCFVCGEIASSGIHVADFSDGMQGGQFLILGLCLVTGS